MLGNEFHARPSEEEIPASQDERWHSSTLIVPETDSDASIASTLSQTIVPSTPDNLSVDETTSLLYSIKASLAGLIGEISNVKYQLYRVRKHQKRLERMMKQRIKNRRTFQQIR